MARLPFDLARASLMWARLMLGVMAMTLATAAYADSWLPAKVERYRSPNGQVELTITPNSVSGLEYFEAKAREEREGARTGPAAPTARAVLRRRTGGRWEPVWNGALVNEVAPVSALVADSGRFVTFDNWPTIGVGRHVVVIYDPGGRPVRSFELSDLLPADWIAALPHSVSSILWGGAHRLSDDDSRVVLSVAIPESDNGNEESYANLEIELASGQVVSRTDAAWQHATAQASRVAQEVRAAAAREQAARAAPLTGPTATDELSWHGYLEEAFFRLDPSAPGGYPDVQVLRAPTARDYRPSERWLRDALLGKDFPVEVLMIASPAAPDNLAAVVTKVAGKLKPGELSDARIYVVAPPPAYERIAAALAPTGAKLIALDPAVPIPQRAGRFGSP